jgi:spore maturation protein CgeB
MPDASGFAQLRHACDQAGATLAFWLHDDPYEFDFRYKVLDVADFIFSNDKWATLHYEHPRVAHLPMAASRRAHWRPVRTDKSLDVFFCGVAFENRKRLAADLARVLVRQRTRFLGDGWPLGQLPFAENRRLNNAELADHYADAFVTLNMGRDLDLANRHYQLCPSTPGPRTFEAAMAGATQMFFVESLEIADYFAPDREIVLFDSVREFELCLTELLAAPEQATAIGAAAQQRALAEHCYTHRAQHILATVCGTDSAP